MGILDRLWTLIEQALFDEAPPTDSADRALLETAQAVAPVVWLLGKTGAGKTSIIAALTGDSRAEIGEGFKPCTRSARIYDFPAEAPLLRFLDTRGFGEPGYDPSEDMAWCEGRSHLLLVAMQVGDAAQSSIAKLVRAIRGRNREWPLIVAQTGLHRLYRPDAMRHPEQYPFSGEETDLILREVPHTLRQALAYQRHLFDDLPGSPARFVPVDFTRPDDGLTPLDYGVGLLLDGLERAGPEAFAALGLARLHTEADAIRARARPLIYGFATAAAGVGAVPVPLVGVGGLAGVLAMMMRAVAKRYDQAWTPATFAQFTGAVGGGTLIWWMLRYGFREVLKLVPGLGSWAGGAMNAAAAFALGVAVGEAACVWLGYQRRGLLPPAKEVRQAFAAGLAQALRRSVASAQSSTGGATL